MSPLSSPHHTQTDAERAESNEGREDLIVFCVCFQPFEFFRVETITSVLSLSVHLVLVVHVMSCAPKVSYLYRRRVTGSSWTHTLGALRVEKGIRAQQTLADCHHQDHLRGRAVWWRELPLVTKKSRICRKPKTLHFTTKILLRFHSYLRVCTAHTQ